MLPKRDEPVPKPPPVVDPNPPPVVPVVPPNKLGCDVPDVPPPNKDVDGFEAPNNGFVEVELNADGALVAAPNGEGLDPNPVDAGCPKSEPPNAEDPKAPA